MDEPTEIYIPAWVCDSCSSYIPEITAILPPDWSVNNCAIVCPWCQYQLKLKTL